MSAGSQPSDDASLPKFVEGASLWDRPILPAEWLNGLDPDFAKVTQRVMLGIERGDSLTRLKMQLEKVMSEEGRNATEIAHGLFLWPYLIDRPDELLAAWETAQRWAEPFLDEPETASLLISVAAEFRMMIEDWEDDSTDAMAEGLEALRDALPSEEEIAEWYRKTAAMDAKSVAIRLRGGTWLIDHDRFSEARRLLNEAAELDPANPLVALRLAECERLDHRVEAGLTALERALQHGDEAEVLFEAALMSVEAKRWNDVITYAQRYDRKSENALWTHYLLATALYELGKLDEATAEIEVERQRAGDDEDLHLVALQACIALAAGRGAEGAIAAESVIERSWADAENLSEPAMTEILERLWHRLEKSGEEGLAKRLARRMVVSGIGPEELFLRQRASETERGGLHEFELLVHQPLAEDWPEHVGCLPGQTDWEAYEVVWAVLAEDSDDAIGRMLDWQRLDQTHEPLVLEVKDLGEREDPRPGILAQEIRTEALRV
ncbi:MAG TPA: hypothetical protein DCQ98_21300 [Planctomycetaceae bacterium]|nr:hypothetical protein [Planctomycetaceae bacterium]HRF02148.1 hypothetical protein [Pirellulaceae bacterium]